MMSSTDRSRGESRHDRRSPAPARPEAGSGAAGFGLVEALIAFIILAVGLLAVGGIALSVGAQARDAAYTTDQDQAAQQVLEITATAAFSEVPTGTTDTTVSVGGTSYKVTRSVTLVNPRTKEILVEVPGQGDDPGEKLVTYVYDRNDPPSSS